MQRPDLSETFAALGDRTRFAIVERLIAEGELSAGALQAETEISAPAVSRHLKILRRAGLVERRIDGTHRLYSASARGLSAIGDWAISRREFWTSGLDRLQAAMERED